MIGRVLTRRERQLLEAVCRLLDPPPPSNNDWVGREKTIIDRAHMIGGCFEYALEHDDTSIESVLRTLAKWTSRPLGYPPVDQPVNDSLPSDDFASHG